MPNYVPIQDLTVQADINDNDYVPVSDGLSTFAVKAVKFKTYSSAAAEAAAEAAAASAEAAADAAAGVTPALDTIEYVKNSMKDSMSTIFDLYATGELERGTINSSGASASAVFRVRTKSIKSFQSTHLLIPATGYKILVFWYDSQGNLDHKLNDFTTNTVVINPGDNIRIVIAQVTESTSEADIIVFGRNLKTEIGLQDYLSVKDSLSFYDITSPGSFAHGTIGSTGSITMLNYRVCTPDPVAFPFPIVLRCRTGFRTLVRYFNDSTVIYSEGYDTSDKFIPANVSFKVAIARVTEDTGEFAPFDEFVQSVDVIAERWAGTGVIENNALRNFGKVIGKSLNIIGDSYVANNGESKSYTWWYKFCVKYGIDVVDYGINGNGLVANTGANPVVERYVNMRDGVDYVVVVGGKNDYNAQISIADFKAGLAQLIEGLTAKYIGKKICFFTPWYVPQNTLHDIGNDGAIPLVDYVNAIVDVCKVYSIPCFAGWNSGLATYNSTFRTTYFQGPNDVSHLNQYGHDLFLPKAESFLISL